MELTTVLTWRITGSLYENTSFTRCPNCTSNFSALYVNITGMVGRPGERTISRCLDIQLERTLYKEQQFFPSKTILRKVLCFPYIPCTELHVMEEVKRLWAGPIPIWLLRWTGVRERTSINIVGCALLLHGSLSHRNIFCYSEVCLGLQFISVSETVYWFLSYSPLCDQRFSLSTFPSASCCVPAMIYHRGLFCCWLLAEKGQFQASLAKGWSFLLWLQSSSLAFGAVSLQEGCLMKNLNGVDRREGEILTRTIEETHCALCFARKPSVAMKLCKWLGVLRVGISLHHLLHPGNTCSSVWIKLLCGLSASWALGELARRCCPFWGNSFLNLEIDDPWLIIHT